MVTWVRCAGRAVIARRVRTPVRTSIMAALARTKREEKFPHRVDEYPCDWPGCGEVFSTLEELGKHRSEVHHQATPLPEGASFWMENEGEGDTPKA
jgi:hypothetical protein